jgi:hypothetical protein
MAIGLQRKSLGARLMLFGGVGLGAFNQRRGIYETFSAQANFLVAPLNAPPKNVWGRI